MSSIYIRIKLVRKSNSLTQLNFANKIGLTRDMVTKIELGKSTPTYETLLNIVNEFPINANWLLTGNGEMHNVSTIIEEVGTVKDSSELISYMKEQITELKTEVKEKDNEIKTLTKELTELRKDAEFLGTDKKPVKYNFTAEP